GTPVNCPCQVATTVQWYLALKSANTCCQALASAWEVRASPSMWSLQPVPAFPALPELPDERVPFEQAAAIRAAATGMTMEAARRTRCMEGSSPRRCWRSYPHLPFGSQTKRQARMTGTIPLRFQCRVKD